MKSDRPIYSLTQPYVLAGLLLYPISRFSDRLFNIPLVDLVLPVLLLALLWREGSIHRLPQTKGTLSLAVFLLWIILANLINSIPIAAHIRSTMGILTAFLPVVAYLALRDRTAAMQFITGGILGFCLYFASYAVPEVLSGNISRDLRNIQPTAVVPFALYILNRKHMTRPVTILIWFSILLSATIAWIIEARGPAIAIALTIGLYLIQKLITRSPAVLATILCMAVSMHWILASTTDELYYQVTVSTQDTLSNRERAALIDFSVTEIAEHPIFGISQHRFTLDFADYFAWIDNFRRETDAVHSPHNSMLEYAVFYGIPAAILFLVFITRIVARGIATTTNPWVIAAALAGMIRLMAFYGLSGTFRIEWYAIAFALLFATHSIRSHIPQTDRKQNSTDPNDRFHHKSPAP